MVKFTYANTAVNPTLNVNGTGAKSVKKYGTTGGMADIYVGVGGTARKAKAVYVGVDGAARRVRKVYVGVGGTARLAWSGGLPEFEATLVVEGESRYGTQRRELTVTFREDSGEYLAQVSEWALTFPEQTMIRAFYLTGNSGELADASALTSTGGKGSWGELTWSKGAGGRYDCPERPFQGDTLSYLTLRLN